MFQNEIDHVKIQVWDKHGKCLTFDSWDVWDKNKSYGHIGKAKRWLDGVC
ncbi:hypothetical protein [Oceanihabitans sediminis]|nr:hypothetical protein [Oceanihabitans sediminis]MDX1279385.1 hypothetical protein [Oceanihabitans sediminis]